MTLGTLMTSPADEEVFEDPKPRRSWWRRKRWGLYILILALAAGAEYAGSRAIRAKLIGLVARKLDAQLEIGTLIYVPPYGANVWNVKLTRGGKEIVTLPGATIRLAKLPLGGASPIVISRFWVDKPALTLGPETFKGMMKSSGREQAPRRLSEMLRLREVHVAGLRIAYHDGRHDDPAAAAVWDRLDLDADLQQQAPSKYNLHVMSKAAATADASATGTIDVDDLLLEIDNLAL
jgi:hypothetical protein